MKYLFLVIITCSLFSCKNSADNQTTKIIYLDKLKREGPVNIDGAAKRGLYQFALIENAPLRPDSLKSLLLGYCDSLVNKKMVEAKYDRYFIQFFKKSAATESYLHGKKDFWDLHNDIMQELEEYLGEYRFERCKTDTLRGQWTLEVHTKDYANTTVVSGTCPN
ncbi:hypothetical protein CLV51_1011056 [Chitinophaga niastensis]|uniref:Uncharacterized protein n=1 Tax=Chitinophaga niastensis TaxID=536980 RepID=A0A2P8HU19_CHINA|nr:hypothetical protein [Chitinophaga niastensis]PSL49721.1 hypothetical protein CLV51_1011056 [Chitinophaga niastensis]